MTPEQYHSAVLALFRQQPGAPRRSSLQDRVVATDLFQRGVTLEILEHVFRLARLRRATNTSLAPIRSLAYYRTVLDSLSLEDLDPGYIAFVSQKAARLASEPENRQAALSDRQNPAVSGSR
jgi:hypothetical protein